MPPMSIPPPIGHDILVDLDAHAEHGIPSRAHAFSPHVVARSFSTMSSRERMRSLFFSSERELESDSDTPARRPFIGFRVLQQAMSGSMAVDLDIASIGSSTSAETASLFYYLLLDAGVGLIRENKGIRLQERFGVGMRIDIEITDIRADVRLDLLGVAIAAESQLARTSLRTRWIGVPQEADYIADYPPPNVLQQGTDSDGKNGLDRVLDYIKGVQHKLATAEVVTPTRYHVILGRVDESPFFERLSAAYAVRCIADGWSLNRALTELASEELNESTISVTYFRWLGSFDAGRTPSPAIRDAAKQWIPFS